MSAEPAAPAAAPESAELVLSEAQQAFLDECEAEFGWRFSEADGEFRRQRDTGTPEPPVMVPWFSRRPFGAGRPWQERGARRGRFESPYDRDRTAGGDRDRSQDAYRDDRCRGREPYRDDGYRGRGPHRDDRHGRWDHRGGDRAGGSGHCRDERRQHGSGW
ncbi:uncharacterized protein LOC119103879 isoform X2 [Pollicipes pollicipes]|uniref:uncharacterized protein LOC119103879 isoform X2 n=1 Tax=Pollicipes pollicipes TaxID=41117 RepID=UPI0018854324|nr:uncharacterized protein LOC119103879 isoform X2 [Pollicipes pollicipes]